MTAIQDAVKNVSDMLARQEYGQVEQLTRGRRVSAVDLERVVGEYGKTLVPLPAEALEDLDIYPVTDSNPPTFHVDVDLWTREEGRSDLTLTLELVESHDEGYDTAVLDLRMQ